MYNEIAKLVMYRDFNSDSVINRLSEIIHDFDLKADEKENLVTRIYVEIRKLLEISTDFGFNRNLWQDYLSFLLITNENPFSLTCEKVGSNGGSVVNFAINDFKIFAKLFTYDFSTLERELSIDCFSTITSYQSIDKKEQMYNRNVSLKVRSLSDSINSVVTGEDSLDEKAKKIFDIVTDFYKKYGVGMFGLNRAFRIRHDQGEEIEYLPINNTDSVMLDDLVGYEIQKKKLRDNTEAFVKGKRANNCLLFGDSGTGKSTSIKAIINEYYDDGLRMIEIYKHQMRDLNSVIAHIKNRNYKFIIYMDDLSFEDSEIEYKYLKAVIEGGLESRPDNVLIYATSNRRHLIQETWKDNNDMELDKHHSDTMQEKLSLVNRFGITIGFIKPNQKDFFNIVTELAARHPEIKMDEEKLKQEATKWEISHGGFSGRTAQQFIDYILGNIEQYKEC